MSQRKIFHNSSEFPKMGLCNFYHLSLFTLLTLLSSAAPDIASDRAALLSLRSAVGGRVLFWNLSSATPCGWAGVICSPENSSVVELRLPAMGLSGQLPQHTISNLTNLHTLSLRYNSLSGPLPAGLFSSLTSLRNLYMQHNFFFGEVPDSLFSVSSLVRVNLAGNNFSGPISPAFNKLNRLATLYLQDNHFSGAIPDLNQPGLQHCDVSNNNLAGRIPHSLAGKPRASFSGNSLCGEPLDSCSDDDKKPKKRLSGAAIAGVIIGSVIGLFLILLVVFCVCKMFGRKGDASKGVEIPAQGKEKGLVLFGKKGWDFDLEELLRASAEVLGKGTMGTTYRAAVESGVVAAVKRVRDVDMAEEEFRKKMEELGKLDHQNLVGLRGYYYNKDEKLLLFDFLPMGSLSALLHANKGGGRAALNWETRVAIALGAANAVAYLHSQGQFISHGNIKSSNILLTTSYEPRVSDFGLAQLDSSKSPLLTTHLHKEDVYSFGVLLLELLTGRAHREGLDLPLWARSVVREEWASQVFDIELLCYRNVEEDMVELLQLALDLTEQFPDNRPTMAEAAARIEEVCGRSLNGVNSDVGEEIGS